MVVSVVDVSAGGAWVSPPTQAESMAVAARRVNFFNERLPIVPARSTKQRGPLPKVPWLGAVAASNFPEANIDQDFDRSVAARIVRDVRAAFRHASATPRSGAAGRSEESRVGNEGVSSCRAGGAP